MPVYCHSKKCIPFRDNWRPVNIMRNGVKIAGYSVVSNTANNEETYIPNTYNDVMEYTVHGKSEQLATLVHYIKWNQYAEDPNILDEAQYTPETSFTNLSWDLTNHLVVRPSTSTSATMVGIKLNMPMIVGHTYMAISKASWSGVDFRTEKYSATAPRFNRGQYCIYEQKYEGSDGTPQKVYLRNNTQGVTWNLMEFAIIDVDLFFGDASATGRTKRVNLINDIINTIGFPPLPINPADGYEEDVEFSDYADASMYTKGGGEVTPDNPADVESVKIKVETAKSNAEWEGLMFADTVNQDGRVFKYTKTAHIYDLNWRKTGDNTFTAKFTDRLSGPVYCVIYQVRDNLSQHDYGFTINENTNEITVKDKDASTPEELIQLRGPMLLYYKGNRSTVEQIEPQVLLTSPYETYLKTNTEITYTVKKYD